MAGTGAMDTGMGTATGTLSAICTRTHGTRIHVPGGYTHTRVDHYPLHNSRILRNPRVIRGEFLLSYARKMKLIDLPAASSRYAYAPARKPFLHRVKRSLEKVPDILVVPFS